MNRIANELRLALRSLARQRIFAIVACLTLAIGVGANTAIFSVINGVLLQPLPYANGNELVLVNTVQSEGPGSMSYPDIADLRDKGRSFRSLIGYGTNTQTLTDIGEPTMIDVARVTEGLLSTFGVAPVLGRDLLQSEFGVGKPLVVVLSYAFWQERFGGAQDVLGKRITLNSLSYEIVGVAPEGFAFPQTAQVWIPRALNLQGCARGCHTFASVGRLAEGVSLEGASSELAQFGVALEKEYPQSNTGKRFMVRNLKDGIVGDVRPGLWIMFGAASLVLLIACANVANLLLARASAREGEIAVRVALGATRGRLAGLVLAESAVLAAIGGGAGIGLAYLGVSGLRSLAATTIPRAGLIVVDSTVLLVTVLSIVVVMLAFAVIPALTATGSSVTGGLSSVGRGGATTNRTIRFRRALLTAEVALSASLLIGAGLLLRTFSELYAVDVGFETQEVSRFSIVLPDNSYGDPARVSQFYSALEEATAALPGVESVGTMFGPPLGRGNATGGVLIQGKPEARPGEEPEASVRSVTPALLATLRIPLKSGRLLTAADNRRDAEPVALVNEEFVRQNFPGEDPIGKRFSVTVDMGFGSPVWRIVGVVGDVRFSSITQDAGADVYLPHAQFGPASTTVHVRTAPGVEAQFNAIRQIVAKLDPSVPIYRTESMKQVISNATAPTRLYMVLVGLFAALAAVLAAIGLYGVVSYVVVQRTREIGIRVALGAQRERVIALVVRQGMTPALLGLAIGVAVALAAGRYVESVLYGVSPRDPGVMIVAISLMAVVALIATVVPALRASRIDPAKVLSAE